MNQRPSFGNQLGKPSPQVAEKKGFGVPEKKYRDELVVLWEKQNKSGVKYLSSKIYLDKEYNVIFFGNKNRTVDSHPHYLGYITEGDERKEVAALWTKTDKNGKLYYSGKFNINSTVTYTNIFSNNKKADNHPDFRAFKD